MSVFRGNKVLVTGGAGFLGRQVISKLASQYRVVSVTHGQCDLYDRDAYVGLLEQERPDAVVHLAKPPSEGIAT